MKARVFIGLGDICGYYTQLERGFLEVGVSCTFVNAFPDRDYGRLSRPGWIGRFAEWVAQRRISAARGSLTRRFWSAMQAGSLVLLLAYALVAFDVFIFSGGTTFLFQRDLWLLKLFRKRVIVVFHGSDSRPPYLNAASVGIEGPFDVDGCVRETRVIKRKLRTIERYADVIVNHSMNSHLHERRIVNWLHVGIPYEAGVAAAARTSATDGAVVIVHAPTRPGPKGTLLIERAIASLQQKGHPIRFVKLIDQPHAQVLKALSECDFVVDELFSDTTMASFAMEAATFGKPTIVGMQGLDALRRYTSPDVIPPALVCRADDAESAIERLVVDHEYRVQLGLQARRFLEEHWTPGRVAARFVRLASGDIPSEWWFDPNTIDYLYGWGLTDSRAREVIQTIVDERGPSALEVADKPALQRAFVDFAMSGVARARALVAAR
jgi:glycosyltransferase involved in cell wall biosynthesis